MKSIFSGFATHYYIIPTFHYSMEMAEVTDPVKLTISTDCKNLEAENYSENKRDLLE